MPVLKSQVSQGVLAEGSFRNIVLAGFMATWTGGYMAQSGR